MKELFSLVFGLFVVMLLYVVSPSLNYFFGGLLVLMYMHNMLLAAKVSRLIDTLVDKGYQEQNGLVNDKLRMLVNYKKRMRDD